MLSYQDAAAEVMEHLCSHSTHGYSQPNRQGIGTGGNAGETVTLSDGTRVAISTGDRDCSSAAIECYAALGVDVGGATYTGNMRSCMTGTGNFRWIADLGQRRRGDILLNERHHTAVYLGDGRLGQFSISETGGVSGQRGDQTAHESNVRAYYNYPWDGILRYCGPSRGEEDEVTDADIEKIAKRVWEVSQGSWTADRVQRCTYMLKSMCGLGKEDTASPADRYDDIRSWTMGRWERALMILKGLSGIDQEDTSRDSIRTPLNVSLSDGDVERIADALAERLK